MPSIFRLLDDLLSDSSSDNLTSYIETIQALRKRREAMKEEVTEYEGNFEVFREEGSDPPSFFLNAYKDGCRTTIAEHLTEAEANELKTALSTVAPKLLFL